MKKIFFLLILNCFLITFLIAQKAPQGMKYQAVARNTSGEVMASEKISMRINLASVEEGKTTVHYTEVHDVVTNEIGLFTLVIGEGRPAKGAFKSIPWSTGEIWMEIGIKEKSGSDFIVISNSKLLAVPYAFHAGTASEIARSPGIN